LPTGQSATLAIRLWHQNDCLPARRLKDVRTALAFLAKRKGVDPERMALWGEGFVEPNGSPGRKFRFAETGFRQCSPSPKRLVEPTGAWLAMLAALYPVEGRGGPVRVRAVLARGGLHAFASVLAEPHHYLPVDTVIPGLLREADVADVVRALRKGKVDVLAEDLRDGANRVVDAEGVKDAWGDTAPKAYSSHPTEAAILGLLRALKKEVGK
jgi:hypothetical protein